MVGISVTSSATRTAIGIEPPAIGREGWNGGDGEQEDDGQPDQQDIERDFVGRLLAFRALDQRDHAVEERIRPPRR